MVYKNNVYKKPYKTTTLLYIFILLVEVSNLKPEFQAGVLFQREKVSRCHNLLWPSVWLVFFFTFCTLFNLYTSLKVRKLQMRQEEVDEDEMSVMSDDFDTKSRCKLTQGEKEYEKRVNWHQNQVGLREYREKMARKYRFVIGWKCMQVQNSYQVFWIKLC